MNNCTNCKHNVDCTYITHLPKADVTFSCSNWLPDSTREHALLAPSNAKQWLKCTPSIKLAQRNGLLQDKITSFALEGTLAHKYVECILKGIDMEVDSIMSDYCIQYIRECKKLMEESTLYAIEDCINLSFIVPECWGTADFWAYKDNCLYLNDFKYGQYVTVNAYDNYQLQLYALGIIHKYNLVVEHVIYSIYQPRITPKDTWISNLQELEHFCNYVKPRGVKAHYGYGNLNSGTWCIYCTAKVICSTYKKYIKTSIYQDSLESNAIEAHKMKKYYSDILTVVKEKLVNGEEFTNFRLETRYGQNGEYTILKYTGGNL